MALYVIHAEIFGLRSFFNALKTLFVEAFACLSIN